MLYSSTCYILLYNIHCYIVQFLLGNEWWIRCSFIRQHCTILLEQTDNKELREKKGQTFIKAEHLFLLFIYFCATVSCWSWAHSQANQANPSILLLRTTVPTAPSHTQRVRFPHSIPLDLCCLKKELTVRARLITTHVTQAREHHAAASEVLQPHALG